MKKIYLFLIVFFVQNFSAQSDSLSKKISYSVYGEAYFSSDFSKSGNHEKLPFLYNFNRDNELNINLILGKINFNDKNYRANIGVMAGTYAEANLASEPSWAKFIYEANAGVKISKNKNIWIDAGIMPSHIGWESAVGADNLTLTRSIVAENSPYYEAGAKISYTNPSEKLNISALYLNGWQRIRKPDGINKPSFGFQLNYKISKAITLNYSNFLGTDKADSLKSFRTYHDFYAQINPSKKVSAILGFDIGTEKTGGRNSVWFSPVAILGCQISDKSKIAGRAEFFQDKSGVMISQNGGGSRMFGVSANYDYRISDHFIWRSEVRNLSSDDNFVLGQKNNFSATTSLCVKF